jgi:hypothetical protein
MCLAYVSMIFKHSEKIDLFNNDGTSFKDEKPSPYSRLKHIYTGKYTPIMELGIKVARDLPDDKKDRTELIKTTIKNEKDVHKQKLTMYCDTTKCANTITESYEKCFFLTNPRLYDASGDDYFCHVVFNGDHIYNKSNREMRRSLFVYTGNNPKMASKLLLHKETICNMFNSF